MQSEDILSIVIKRLMQSKFKEAIQDQTDFDDKTIKLLFKIDQWKLYEKIRLDGDKRNYDGKLSEPNFDLLSEGFINEGEIFNSALITQFINDWEKFNYKEEFKPWLYSFEHVDNKISNTIISLDIFVSPNEQKVIGWMIDID